MLSQLSCNSISTYLPRSSKIYARYISTLPISRLKINNYGYHYSKGLNNIRTRTTIRTTKREFSIHSSSIRSSTIYGTLSRGTKRNILFPLRKTENGNSGGIFKSQKEKVESTVQSGKNRGKSLGNNNNNNNNKKLPTLSWKSVGILAIAASILVGYYQFMMQKRNKKKPKARGVGTPDIGGPFTLVDHNGIPVTDATFRGKYMLLYFGFTFCPDICPAELDKITIALENLVEKQRIPEGTVIPMFVSLDPWRDSVAKIRQYIEDFHPMMIGLTGTPEQVNNMAAEYRVYSASSQKDNYGEGDYLVDHSVYSYLIGPDGSFVAYFGSDYNPDKMARKMAEIIREGEDEEIIEEGFIHWIKNLFFPKEEEEEENI